MKYLLFITLLVTLFISKLTYSQSITTGQVGENDIYTDFEPDKSISCSVSTHANDLNYIYIDADQNGINDFVIRARGFGALGGGTGDITIYGANNQNQILSHSETSEVYPGGNYITVNVPDTLNEGIDISDISIYNLGSCYFMSTYYGPVDDQPSVNTWQNKGEYYIGFRIKPYQDTLYGWIRVELTSDMGTYTITCKDMACNINEYANYESVNSSSFSLYPNPSSKTLYVNGTSQKDIDKIDIYNISGQKVKSVIFNDKNLSIDISDLPKGTYFLHSSTKNEFFRKKFIKI